MIWNVFYTEDAEQDLQSIYEYISDVLLEPLTAQKQSDRIMDAVDSFDHMPLRHPLYEKEPWQSRGLRVMAVDNYLVFYLPVESHKTVAIIRIIYGGCDITTQLNKTE